MTATPGQQKEYQTTLMRAVVNGVLDGDFLKGSASSQSNFSKFALSIGNFSSKLVDKLWIGELKIY